MPPFEMQKYFKMNDLLNALDFNRSLLSCDKQDSVKKPTKKWLLVKSADSSAVQLYENKWKSSPLIEAESDNELYLKADIYGIARDDIEEIDGEQLEKATGNIFIPSMIRMIQTLMPNLIDEALIQ